MSPCVRAARAVNEKPAGNSTFEPVYNVNIGFGDGMTTRGYGTRYAGYGASRYTGSAGSVGRSSLSGSSLAAGRSRAAPTRLASEYMPSYAGGGARYTAERDSVREVFRAAGAESVRKPAAGYLSAGSGSVRSNYTSARSAGGGTSLPALDGSAVRGNPNPAAATHPKGTCDRCDGPHLTDNCHVFKKERENHPDATRRRSVLKDIGGGGGTGPGSYLSSARVVGQPGDGSCLFHSLAYGLGRGNARQLRQEIARYISNNQDLEIAGDKLRDWVRWDSGTSVSTYCSRMAVSGWGGGIEMAAFSRMYKVSVHVYERCGGAPQAGLCGPGGAGRVGSSFKRVSAFDVPGSTKTVRVLYRGARVDQPWMTGLQVGCTLTRSCRMSPRSVCSNRSVD